MTGSTDRVVILGNFDHLHVIETHTAENDSLKEKLLCFLNNNYKKKKLIEKKFIECRSKSALPFLLSDEYRLDLKKSIFQSLDLNENELMKKTKENFLQKFGCIGGKIGRGAYGVVNLVIKEINETDKQFYAIKKFKRRLNQSFESYSIKILSEYLISKTLMNHPNIIKTFGLYNDTNENLIQIMEYCPGGTLSNFIKKSNYKLKQIEIDCFFKQIINGVSYMHLRGISHRDLKTDNILLTENGTIKIVDFGTSDFFRLSHEQEVKLSQHLVGSLPYIAPEEFVDDLFDPRLVDIWACGIILLKMVYGHLPWDFAKLKDTRYARYIQSLESNNIYKPFLKVRNENCRDLLKKMLDPLPTNRPFTEQVLESKWISNIICCHDKVVTTKN